MNQGRRYEQAIRSGNNPSSVDLAYSVRKTQLQIGLAGNAVNWLGTNIGAANGVLSSIASQPLNTAGRVTVEALEDNASKLNSFTDGVYEMATASDDMIVYRVSGGSSTAESGDYFSTIKPRSSAEAEQLLNINAYGNTGTAVTPVVIKKGSQFAVGGVEGGTGTQVFIPKGVQNSGGNKINRLLDRTEKLQ